MKRISFVTVIILFFLLSIVSSFGEEKVVVSGKDFNDLLQPETKIIVYVSYPDSEPVSYCGETVANLDDAVILNIKDKLFYVRKRFIEKLVILLPEGGKKIAMLTND